MDEDDEFAYYEMTQVILNMSTYENGASPDDKILIDLYIEACRRAQKALKEQCDSQKYRIPKKVKVSVDDYGTCPTCGNVMWNDGSHKFCNECGQALEWK